MVNLDSLSLDHTNKNKTSIVEKNKAFPWLIIIFGIIVIISFFVMYGNASGDEVDISNAKIETATAFLQQNHNSIILIAGGRTENFREISVSSKLEENIIFLNVEEGNYIEKDEIIAKLDDSKLRADFIIANSTYQKALIHYKRTQLAYSDQSVSTGMSDYALRYAELEEARAIRDLANINLQHTIILAPISGIIIKKFIENGEMTSVGSAIVTISDPNELRVRSDINDIDIEKVSIGQSVEIRPDASKSRVYHGYIYRIQPVADKSKNTIQIKVNITDIDNFLRPEMRVKLTILNNGIDEEKLQIPSNAILRENGKQFVFIKRNSQFSKHSIECEDDTGEYTKVLSGLLDGDIVATSDLEKLNTI